MPTIMGAAALVMADLTGVGNLNIIIAALVPALFYYFSLFCAVTVEARRQDIKVQPLKIDDKITRVDMINSILIIGQIAAVIFALAKGLSTSTAGFWAVIVLVACRSSSQRSVATRAASGSPSSAAASLARRCLLRWPPSASLSPRSIPQALARSWQT